MLIARTPTRRPGGTLYRYFTWEMIFPTLYTLGGFTMVVLTKDMLGFSDLVINRGLEASTVAWMALYQTLPLLSEMLPFAVMVGCLVALGRLAADNEILILEASGVSAPRLLGPVVAFAASMGALGIVLSLYVAPWANRGFETAMVELARTTPSAIIQSGRVHHFGDWKLEAREASAAGDQIKGVLLWLPDIGETVFAREGLLVPDEEGGSRLTLEEGMLVLNAHEGPRQLRFDTLEMVLPAGDEPISNDMADEIRGASMLELAQRIRGSESTEAEAKEAVVELHRRFSLSAATLVFGLLVVPLFMSRAHFSRSGGGLMGILVTLVYYGLVQLGDGLVHRGSVSIAVGVWLPNIALGLLAAVLLARLRQMTAFARGSDRPVSKSRSVLRLGRDATRLRPVRWPLERYVSVRFLQMALLCFGVVLVAYLVVDVLERMRWLSEYSATASEVLRYYGARIPLLASRVLPMSLLVATALTVSLLAAQGELMGMRCCGVPLARALLPILVICAFIAPAYFALNDLVLPRTNAMASYLKNIEIKGRSREDGPKISVWYRTADQVYEAEHLDPVTGFARDITVYELGPRGFPTSRLDAPLARHIGFGRWRLVDPKRIEISERSIVEAVPVPVAKLGEDVPSEIDTRQLSVRDLRREIAEVERSGHVATSLYVDLYVKLAAPFACFLLPALALFFAVTGPPHPSSNSTLVLSVLVSIAYVLLTGVGTSLGYGGKLPPVVAGFGAVGVFGLIAMVLGLRLKGLGQRA